MSASLPDIKTCAHCGNDFAPQRPMQAVCGPRCALRKVKAAKAAEKAQTRARREAMMTHGDWVELAQAQFNRYIRLRDAGKPCICCGKPMEPPRPGGSVDAGHYRSRGSAPHLRFDEVNTNAQRKSCNRPGGTTAASFRAGMIKRYGLAVVEALEADQTPRKYTIPDLIEIRDTYRRKANALAAERDNS